MKEKYKDYPGMLICGSSLLFVIKKKNHGAVLKLNANIFANKTHSRKLSRFSYLRIKVVSERHKHKLFFILQLVKDAQNSVISIQRWVLLHY